MRVRDVKSDYRGWKFRDKVPLISKEQQWLGYFDSKFDGIDVDVDVDIDTDEIKESIKTTLEEELCHVHKHIDDAKCHLCCKINSAKNCINQHIDEKIEPIMHFEGNFSNLNEQVQQILNKLN